MSIHFELMQICDKIILLYIYKSKNRNNDKLVFGLVKILLLILNVLLIIPITLMILNKRLIEMTLILSIVVALYVTIKTTKVIINFVRKNINRYRGVEISWFGGEPLMEPDVIDNISKQVIQICEKAHKPYWGTINTNGFLLSPPIVDMLIRNKVFNLVVTIDGIKEEHDKVRVQCDGSPTFDIIIKNLMYIKKTIKTRALAISIRTNLTASMLNHMDDYYDYFNDCFGDDSRFSLFIRVAGDWGGERVKSMASNLLDINKKNTFDVMFEKMTRLIRNSPQSKLYFPMNFTDINTGGSTCRARYMHKYTVAVDGNLTKCDDDSNVFSIGRLNKDGVMQLNENNNAAWLSAFPNNTACDDCFFSCTCMMGACPKSTLFGYKSHCPKLELDGLLKLYCATFTVPYLN